MFIRFERSKEFSNFPREDYIPGHICVLLAFIFSISGFILGTPNPFRRLISSFLHSVGGHVNFFYWTWFIAMIILFVGIMASSMLRIIRSKSV